MKGNDKDLAAFFRGDKLRQVTEKQINYIFHLMEKNGRHSIKTLLDEVGYTNHSALETLSTRQASEIIDFLLGELLANGY